MSKKPYGALDTAKFSYNFFSDNFRYYLDVLKPLLPVLLLDAWLSGALDQSEENPDNPTWLLLLSILAGTTAFIYGTCFIITWHRSVIHGPSHAIPANPLRMKKPEWQFLLSVLGVLLGLFAIGLISGVTLGFLGKAFMPIAIICGIALLVITIIYATRLYLYFPAKAAGADITFKQALEMGKGLTSKLIAGTMIGLFPVILLSIVLFSVAGLVLSLILGLPETIGDRLVMSLFLSPIKVFITTFSAAIMVGVYSRYYMWAVQERPLPPKAE